MRCASLLALFAVAAIALTAASAALADAPADSIVYASHCAVCHGLEGDGQGPAASMFVVKPRDFRLGVFKFRSTPYGALPTDDDLARTITSGLRWTGMIGHSDLSEIELKGTVDHLKTFSRRFVTEAVPAAIAVGGSAAPVSGARERGEVVYRQAGCIACHGAHGAGDGPAGAGLRDVWGEPIRPSDLTWRPLKRGSDPRAIALTVVAGPYGTPMPAYRWLPVDDLDALVAHLDTLVPADRRLPPQLTLGEERRALMVMRHHGMGHMHGPRGMMMR